MSISAAPVACYLVEWYQYQLTDETVEGTVAVLEAGAMSMSAEGSPVRLLTVLAVPDDDVIFGVFTAGSAADVATTCARAGLPAQRLTAAQISTAGGHQT